MALAVSLGTNRFFGGLTGRSGRAFRRRTTGPDWSYFLGENRPIGEPSDRCPKPHLDPSLVSPNSPGYVVDSLWRLVHNPLVQPKRIHS